MELCCCSTDGLEVPAPSSQIAKIDSAQAADSDAEEEIDASPFSTPSKLKTTIGEGYAVEQWSSHGKLTPQDLDFSELTRGNRMLRLNKIDRRGITFDQLKQILAFMKRRCDESGAIRGWYDPETGEQLHYKTINMRQLNYWVIKPVTERRQCSYVEAVCKDEQAQLPAWFVGHTWGQPFMEFTRRAMQRGTLGAGDAFWSFAFATRWDDCSEMTCGKGPTVVDFHSLSGLRACFTGSLRVKTLEELQRNLPYSSSLKWLDLDMSGCPSLGIAAPFGTNFAVLRSLAALRLCFRGCTSLWSVEGLCRSLAGLGRQLDKLELIVSDCSNIRFLGGDTEGEEELVGGKPRRCLLPGMKSLSSLTVDASNCENLMAVDILSEEMKNLDSVKLNFSGCTSLTSLDILAESIGQLKAARRLDMSIAGSSSLKSLGDLGEHVRRMALESFRLDLSSCPALDESSCNDLSQLAESSAWCSPNRRSLNDRSPESSLAHTLDCPPGFALPQPAIEPAHSEKSHSTTSISL